MFSIDFHKSFKKSFYSCDASTVAKELIGNVLVNKTPTGTYLAGRIVETEAYLSHGDQSSHSAPGLTKRNTPMFETGGLLYVYMIYGIHHCANIVTGKKGQGEAVLIRALEPILGLEEMQRNRGRQKIENLCKGPGNTAKSFGFTKSDNFRSLTTEDLFVQNEHASLKKNIGISTRIGINKSKELELRFYRSDSKYVSKQKKNE